MVSWNRASKIEDRIDVVSIFKKSIFYILVICNLIVWSIREKNNWRFSARVSVILNFSLK